MAPKIKFYFRSGNELSDLSRISRTFYDVDSCYVEMVGGLPQPVLLASADIIEQAEINLDCELNSNVTFTLADHLNFAIERLGKGLDILYGGLLMWYQEPQEKCPNAIV